jgi:hypothetical protein
MLAGRSRRTTRDASLAFSISIPVRWRCSAMPLWSGRTCGSCVRSSGARGASGC